MDTFGKALAAIASLAVFVYLIGGATVLVRLDRLELPAEAIIPEIPRERLALLGLTQILWSLLLAGALSAAAFWALPGREPKETWRKWKESLAAHDRRRWAGTLVALALVVALAPVSVNGLLYVLVLLGGTAWFLACALRVHPLITVIVAIGMASVLTIARELEFPSPFPTAVVTLSEDVESLVPESVDGKISARVIEKTDDEVLLGYESAEQDAREAAEPGLRLPPVLLVLPRDQVIRMTYGLPGSPQSHSDSLLQKVFDWPPPMCLLSLACEWDTAPDGNESGEETYTVPLVF